MNNTDVDIIKEIGKKYINKDYQHLPILDVCHEAQDISSRIYFDDFHHAYSLLERLIEKKLISTFIAFPIPDYSSDKIGDWFVLDNVRENRDANYFRGLVAAEGCIGMSHIITNENGDFFFNIYEDDAYALTAKDEIFQALGADTIELNMLKLIDNLKLDPEIIEPSRYWIARYLWGDKWLNAFEVKDQ